MIYDPRLDRLANVLVRYSTRIKKGDVVRIRMATLAEPLALAVYKEVLSAGGHPFISLAPEECGEFLARYGKLHQLAYSSHLDLHEAKTLDADISAWGQRNTRAMSNIDAKKQAAISKARSAVVKVMLNRMAASGKKKLRWVGTQYPCQSAAQEAEMSLTEYADFVFRAGLLHLPDPIAAWKKVSATQQRLADYLEKTSEIRYVAPGGTDIRFGVKGRHWVNCDGINNFPDGEVFTGPWENATEGEIRFNFPAVYRGREVADVWLKFRGGKVVDADATKGRDFLYQMMDQDKGGRVLGELAIGTNYAIQKFTRNTLFDEKIGGTVHMALGASIPESGGKNVSALHWDIVNDMRKGGVIEADGKPISRNGKFLCATWPQPSKRRSGK